MRKGLLFIGTLILIAIVISACGDDKSPVTSTNHAPGQPILDGPSGSPPSGSTGITLTPTLKWTCTDSDGDVLTYTVSFGTASTPPVVSTDQSSSSYSPSPLTYSTTYYWSVSAKDPAGASTSSPVWSFTTIASPNEFITTSTAPTGPATGFVSQSLSYTAIGASSSFGDDLEYKFDWGGGNFSDWGTATALNSWDAPGTYGIKVQARCIQHPEIISEWSDASSVVISEIVPETISTPDAPDGPATGIVDQNLAYDGKGAVSSDNHDLEYRFDWGDGSSLSDWSAIAISHSWAEGEYQIMTQARCTVHNDIESGWSSETTVTITAFALETISPPGSISGLGAGEVGESISFACAEAISNKGHTVYYRWDFGDGNPTTWSSLRSRSHAWATAGTYEVKARARCNDHRTIISDWSETKTVTITPALTEIVTPPDAPGAPESGFTGEGLAITVSGATSSYGHAVRYRISFGDGDTTSGWYDLPNGIQHIYETVGTYEITAQARCYNHPSIESEWSEATSIVIVRPPEALAYNTGLVYGDVTEGQINESYEYSVSHSSVTTWGDPMEGQYDWGDGDTTAWLPYADIVQSHTWTEPGTYNVTYKARCTLHHDFMINSGPLVVTLLAVATETVATPRYINWQDAQDRPMLDTETMYYAYGGLSSLGHDTEDRIAWGDGDTTGWVAASTQIFKTWNVLGTFLLTRQSRCIAHPDVISEWSEQSYIITGPESVSTPDAPPGPATATKGSAVRFLGTGAESSWHSYSWLSYRFAWGDGDTTAWRDRLDTLVGHNYSSVGEYEVTVQAKCVWPGHTNPISEWSLPSVINILESITFNESVSGPTDGPINKSLTFELNFSATSSEGHDMEYRFAFGDSDTSLWAAELTASHAYTIAGSYLVKAQARCATHHEAMTEWPTTNLHRVDITDDPETVTMPRVSVGLQTTIGDSTGMRFEKSVSNYGDSLEFQIDYGDGSGLSEWFPSAYDKYRGEWDMVPEWTYHTYTAVGSYGVRGRARCVEHPTVISEWSEVTFRQTAVILESISMPAVTGPETGVVGENMTFTTTGSISSEGHDVEYIWSYRGPENQYTDYTTSLTDTKVFSLPGEYYVWLSARCVTHEDAESLWSEKFYFTITE